MPSTNALLFLLLALWQNDTLRLKPCPDSPNCVNTYQDDEKHSPMPALTFTSSAQNAMQLLVDIITEMPRTKVVERDSAYLHVEFKIAVFGFIDDVEFQVFNDKIHYRSASRKGYYDLGVNRNRMKDIQAAWAETTDNKKSGTP